MKQRKDKKAMMLSFAIHLGVITAGIIPLVGMVQREERKENEAFAFIEIAFEDGHMSPSSSSVRPERSTEQQVSDVEKEERAESNAELAESSDSDVFMDEKEEVEIEEMEEVQSMGEGKESEDSMDESESEKGEGLAGNAISGESLAGMDFDGEGVFGRRIVYHANISKLAEKEGRVVVNLCINRSGRVTHIAFNREASSLTDSDYVSRVMQVASKYRFEADYSAPEYQCGKLTFIFEYS